MNLLTDYIIEALAAATPSAGSSSGGSMSMTGSASGSMTMTGSGTASGSGM